MRVFAPCELIRLRDELGRAVCVPRIISHVSAQDTTTEAHRTPADGTRLPLVFSGSRQLVKEWPRAPPPSLVPDAMLTPLAVAHPPPPTITLTINSAPAQPPITPSSQIGSRLDCAAKCSTAVICVALMAFAYMSAHTPVGTHTSIDLVAPQCRWQDELLNLFLCFKPGFDSRPTSPAVQHKSSGPARCSGEKVDALFAKHSGDDGVVDGDEAGPLAADVDRAIAAYARACQGMRTPMHTCFAHATRSDEMDTSQVEAFIACRLAGLPSVCSDRVCK